MTTKNGTTNGHGVAAVAYYRMSTDRQEDSIDRQRSQVELYAARHGYRIIEDYADEGIAGDEEGKRKAFIRMLDDAAKKKFKVILCDDKDRFGRFDSISYGYYVKPLRDVGVRLETCAQGCIDWSSFAGRITDAILQEAKKIESQATSRRVMTRMLLMAKAGKWLGGPAPYGYDLVADAQLGKRLVPGDPQAVEGVQLMFHLYGERGCSLDAVASELFKRGILPPKSPHRKAKGATTWNKTTLRAILRNRKYLGDMPWNVGHEGKYSEFRSGMVQTSDTRLEKRSVNPVDDWIIATSTHEPLVSRAIFEKVQRRLTENQKRTTPKKHSAIEHVLTGLLICGRCGYVMTGSSTTDGKRYYRCSRYHQEGKQACFHNSVMEEKLLVAIVRKLKGVFLDPKNRKKIREEARRQAATTTDDNAKQRNSLERQHKTLDTKITQAMERMAIIDRELLGEFSATVRGWKEERDRIQAQLKHLGGQTNPPDVEALVRAAESLVENLESVVTSGTAKGDAALVREMLRELVDKVELQFNLVEKAKKTSTKFAQGIIYLKPQLTLDTSSHLCNAVNPIREGTDA